MRDCYYYYFIIIIIKCIYKAQDRLRGHKCATTYCCSASSKQFKHSPNLIHRT